MGVIARVAEILQEGVQLGKIVIERGHLAAGAGLGVRRASGLTDGLLYRLAILISGLQHSEGTRNERLVRVENFPRCVKRVCICFSKAYRPLIRAIRF